MKKSHRLLVIIGITVIFFWGWDLMMPKKSQTIPDSAIQLKVDSQVKNCEYTIFLSSQ
ncbi:MULTISPECIES: hypothetical protein [Enterococcus]|uniref:Uncharacterized protein n=1 Tax=Enterococcus alishanensis TaxID=1303817 RepID=A0ABS6TDC5_9ENTE|nr:hypothetical protein [Enterococcus alishanensis]MBV7390908.1 hypothetical protein [Enterococcus alishanensis]